MKSSSRRYPTFCLFALLACFLLAPNVARASTQEPLSKEEQKTWDVLAIFLAGVLTTGSLEELSAAEYIENFRANYAWIKNVFLPHLRESPEHDWQQCQKLCVEAAKRLAAGHQEKEDAVRKALERHKHER